MATNLDVVNSQPTSDGPPRVDAQIITALYVSIRMYTVVLSTIERYKIETSACSDRAQP